MKEQMELIPIRKEIDENAEFSSDPMCRESLNMTIEFYKKVGFVPPWIGYYAKLNGILVGAAAFKGKPVNGTVEIAYGTFEKYRMQGIGTNICRKLVDLSLNTDSAIRITARTLPENNYSSRILEKNNFTCLGMVTDPEDGQVWEWEFKNK